jgi:hypothetical protein
MLRTREFDQPRANGDRPRHWVALFRLAPLSHLAAAPFLSPRYRSPCLPRQLQTPHSTPLMVSVAKNAPRDRIPLATKITRHHRRVAKFDFPRVGQQNELADSADSANSQKPALFHPPGLPSNNLSPFLSRPPHPSATPKSLPPNAFQLPVAILSPKSSFATEIQRATEFERLGRVCSRLLKNGTRIHAD